MLDLTLMIQILLRAILTKDIIKVEILDILPVTNLHLSPLLMTFNITIAITILNLML